jgi:hypothetical protein
VQLFAATSAGDGAQQHIDGLSEQLEQTQAALEAAEADRQVLAAQRDGWMASFQEAYGKLQEWTATSQAAGGKIAARAGEQLLSNRHKSGCSKTARRTLLRHVCNFSLL